MKMGCSAKSHNTRGIICSDRPERFRTWKPGGAVTECLAHATDSVERGQRVEAISE